LCHHGVFAGAKKGSDLQILLDPLKKQLDLPRSLDQTATVLATSSKLLVRKN
jgi:hypothetical protein